MRREAADPMACWHGVRYFTDARRIPFDACPCCLARHGQDSFDLCRQCRLGPEINVMRKAATVAR